LFAGLRDRAGTGEVCVDGLEPGVQVAGLLDHLAQRWPFLQDYPLAISVNCELVEATAVVHDGDEVALLPPVSGGRP
jgi:molybdopterin converting factor small subunit